MAIKHIIAAIAFVLSLAFAVIQPAAAHDPAEHIIHVMKAQFDQPDNPLTVQPVSIVGDFAVAGWSQGGKGGRALLKQMDGQWTIHLCSGAGLREAKLLHEAGMDEASAATLATMVNEAEAKLDPAQVALFDSFEGTMLIGAEGHAGHAGHKHGAQGSGSDATQTQ